MLSRVAAPRVVTLAAVAGLHAGALLWLLAETRTQHMRAEPQTQPILVVLLQALEHRPAAGGGMKPRAPSPHRRVAGGLEMPPEPSRAITSALSLSIDWAAEASSAAERLLKRNERSRQQARAFAPAPSAMFAPPGARPPELPWQPRVEPAGGGAIALHLGDQCALVVLVIIPMVGCTLDKMPARGDLFDHMHDRD
ncbi:MAG TPA: hypothetical protein VKQ31_09045 [Steroidobacteraceae bacterium]|nr:hypothetical protein [Steroidobacteraceae bacterium]